MLCASCSLRLFTTTTLLSVNWGCSLRLFTAAVHYNNPLCSLRLFTTTTLLSVHCGCSLQQPPLLTEAVYWGCSLRQELLQRAPSVHCSCSLRQELLQRAPSVDWGATSVLFLGAGEGEPMTHLAPQRVLTLLTEAVTWPQRGLTASLQVRHQRLLSRAALRVTLGWNIQTTL
jgi:hypothetical protein